MSFTLIRSMIGAVLGYLCRIPRWVWTASNGLLGLTLTVAVLHYESASIAVFLILWFLVWWYFEVLPHA